jgi:hypothetical protein
MLGVAVITTAALCIVLVIIGLIASRLGGELER